ELAREHAAVCLAGNHDLAVTGEIPLGEFSRGASLAAQWTREVIAPENLAFLQTLSPQGNEGSVGLYHASPRDPVWEYVLSALLAELCLDEQRHRLRGCRDPGGPPARLSGRALGVRSMSIRGRIRSTTPLGLLATGVLGASAALLVSCGASSNKLIPVANSEPLQRDFEEVARAA